MACYCAKFTEVIYRSPREHNNIIFFICFKLRFKKENTVAATVKGSQLQCFQFYFIFHLQQMKAWFYILRCYIWMHEMP